MSIISKRETLKTWILDLFETCNLERMDTSTTDKEAMAELILLKVDQIYPETPRIDTCQVCDKKYPHAFGKKSWVCSRECLEEAMKEEEG